MSLGWVNRSWLKKNGRASVGGDTSRKWRAARAFRSCRSRAVSMSAMTVSVAGRSGLASTVKRNLSVVSCSTCRSDRANGARDTMAVARLPTPAMKMWSLGRSTPSSIKVATARLTTRPSSTVERGECQRDTVNRPVGVSAERKVFQPSTV